MPQSLPVTLKFADVSVSAQRRFLISNSVVQSANLAWIMQVGCNPGLKVHPKEGHSKSYNRCQRPQSLRDYHSARGADGTETTEQSTVSVNH